MASSKANTSYSNLRHYYLTPNMTFRLFQKSQFAGHCIRQLLPPLRADKYLFRNRGDPFILSFAKSKLFKTSWVRPNRSRFGYIQFRMCGFKIWCYTYVSKTVLPNLFSTAAHFLGTNHQTAHCIYDS